MIKLQANLLAYSPDTVIIDTANSDGSDMDNATIEALVRRIWTICPQTKIMMFNFFAVADHDIDANVNSPTDEANVLATQAVAAAYGITLVDYWGTIKQRVNSEGHHLNEYMDDTIHPNETGHGEAYDLLSPHLPFGGGAKPDTLPDRIYDTDGLYENTPVVKNGTDDDSRTGTWTEDGTKISSNEAGATITYSATCQSYGCYRADAGTNTVQASIDGGAFANASFYTNGTPIAGGRAAHTITIKVVSGTVRIDEFWAI